MRLDEVVLRALEKKPELRYQQASVLKTQVETIVQTSPSEVLNSKFEMASRFSPAAIMGALLIPVFFISTVFWNFGHLGGTQALVGVVMTTLGFVSIVGATILGWVSVAQIRRSGGRLYGIWLALVDGLLFPGLVLDIVLLLGLLLVNKFINVWLLARWYPSLTEHAFLNNPHFLIWLLFATAAVIGSNYVIVRGVWRAVNQSAKPSAKAAGTRWKAPVVAAAIILLAFIVALIASHFRPAKFTNASAAGLVGWWSAENTASDHVGGNSGVPENGVAFAPGIRGQAFRFNGKGACIKIPHTPALDPTTQLTVEFWMNADPDNEMQNYQGLVTSDFYSVEISKGYGRTMGVNFGLSTTANAPIPANGITGVDNFTHISDANGGGAPVSAGEWHHVAGTYDGSQLRLYLDGKPWGRPVFHTGPIRPMLPDSFVTIGAEDGRTTCPDCIGTRYFKGLIDEVKIFDRALSAEEINAAYSQSREVAAGASHAPAGNTSVVIGPTTGLPIAPGTPVTVDPNTGLPIAPGAAATAIDPTTGLPIAPGTSVTIDPNTGLPIAPGAAATAIDPTTGLPVPAGSAQVDVTVDRQGLVITSLPDDLWQASVTFHNQSSVASPAFSVLFYTGPSPKNGRLISRNTAGPIPAGDTFTEATVPFVLRNDGTEVFAVIDPANLLKRPAESAEWILHNTGVTNKPLVVKTPKPVQQTWVNWNNGQSIGSFYAVAGTPTETVAVGIDGRIATRNNATGVWRIQTFPGDPDFRAIVYAKGQYVVVREGGSIMTSPDGIAWTSRSSPTTRNLLGLFWDGHQYLAGGDRGTILTSPDGITWTKRDSGSVINFYSFSYSGSRYVSVGNDGICISTDSVTWTTPATRWATARIPFTACTWTGTEFLACGLGLDDFPTIYTCPDGNSWKPRDTTVTNSLRAAITINGVIYIAGDSVIKKSTDGGTTWQDTFTNPNSSNKLFMGLAFNGEFLIAAGFNHNVWAIPVASLPH